MTHQYYVYILTNRTRRFYAAIAREKQIESWGRAKNIDLVETMNPEWKDLSGDWYGGAS